MTDNPYQPPQVDPPAGSGDVRLPLQIVYEIEYDLVMKAARLFLRQNGQVLLSRVLTWIAGLPLGIVVLGALAELDPDPALGLLASVAVLVTLVLVTVFTPRILAWATVSMMRVRSTPGLLCQHRIEITADTFKEATDVNESSWKLSAMSGVYANDYLLVVSPSPNQFLPIPCDADFGESSFADVRDFLACNIGRKSRSGGRGGEGRVADP